MYIIKSGSLYFDGSTFVADQPAAKRFELIHAGILRDSLTLMFNSPDIRLVRLTTRSTVQSYHPGIDVPW